MAALAAAGAMVAGCAADGGGDIRVVHGKPRHKAVARVEPVNFNGRMYRVAMRPLDGGHFRVTVSAPGRRLGGRAGDRKVVEQIARSTVRHFNCPDGHKGHIVPGSQRHTGGKWVMNARCG